MIASGDIKILSVIAEYKFLTTEQISILCQRSIPVIRRRLRDLSKKCLISIQERVFGKGVGRKEYVIIISEEGLLMLKSKGILSLHANYITDKTSSLNFIEHDLLVNWFLIHLTQIERSNNRFQVFILTTSSHNLTQGDFNRPLTMERFSNDDKSGKINTMIPDGVFTITDKKAKKALLFFLEVDMGTETLASPTLSPGDIKQKINNYQSLFKYGTYDRYSNIVNNKFNGFRLLFLTDTVNRKESICHLVQSMPPSDFIWVTNQQQVTINGAAAEIWARGGHYNKKPESILSKKLSFKIPAPKNNRNLS
jgi:hypothetical protein